MKVFEDASPTLLEKTRPFPLPRIGPLPCSQCHTALSWRQKTANSEAAPRWREASDTLPLNRESDHTGTSEYRIAKFSVIGEE